jgi:hypothetical protein
LEQVLLGKDQEITSLQHKITVLDNDLEKSESNLAEKKAALVEGENAKANNETLNRKIALLEEELDAAEKNLKETVEKYIWSPRCLCRTSSVWQTPTGRYQGGAFRTSSTACRTRAR